MMNIPDLKFSTLLYAARNYLGEIVYVGQELSNRGQLGIPSELKPFLDFTNSELASHSVSNSTLTQIENLKPVFHGRRKSLFLDRDGVINVDHGYVGKVEQVDLMPGIANLISHANHSQYDVNVVTNQSGIGRGHYTEQDYQDVMTCISKLLEQDQAHLDHIQFAPFHPEAKNPLYHTGREFRKPRPGMILSLQIKHQYNLKNSILIGDKASDIMAAMVAGIGHVYLFESEQSDEEWMILKHWLVTLGKYGLSNEFDDIVVKQLTDFSEVRL